MSKLSPNRYLDRAFSVLNIPIEGSLKIFNGRECKVIGIGLRESNEEPIVIFHDLLEDSSIIRITTIEYWNNDHSETLQMKVIAKLILIKKIICQDL